MIQSQSTTNSAAQPRISGLLFLRYMNSGLNLITYCLILVGHIYGNGFANKTMTYEMTNYGLLNPKGTEVIVKYTQNPTQMQ